MKKTRNTSMDCVRIFALFCVISVHFFLYNGFYNEIISGRKMFVMTLMRTFFMICVPLFIVLSGYLMNKKMISKKYYKGIYKILFVYFGASILCLLFKTSYLHEVYSIRSAIFGFLNFTNAKYAWYVEMYIGLFLLIPFLNLIYNNLNTKKNKQLLIVTMLFLTALPQVVNIYNFMVNDWWRSPVEEMIDIIPDWWKGIYPISYYFIGCYLHEYLPRIRKWKIILMLVVSVLLFGSFNFYRSFNGTFITGPYTEWGAFPNVIMTILVFIFIANINCDKISDNGKIFLSRISNLCFGAYLLSFIFDKMFYIKINTLDISLYMILKYYFILVPLIFLCSIFLSYLLELVINICKKLYYFVKPFKL